MAKKKKKSEYYVPEEYRAEYEEAKKKFLQADFEALVGPPPYIPMSEVIKQLEAIHEGAKRKKGKKG
jgi:hypothetical protein